MSTIKLNIETLQEFADTLPFKMLSKLTLEHYLDEGEVEDDDYDETVGSDPEKSYSVRFEFDGGHIELYDVKAKYFIVL